MKKQKELKNAEEKLKWLYEEQSRILSYSTKSKKTIGDTPEYLSMIVRKLDFLNGFLEGYKSGTTKK